MPARLSEVEPLEWDKFLEMMAVNWKPGEHIALVAPTGAGKTTFEMGLANKLRRYVLACDLKGGDRTLARSGWTRITEWPLSQKERKALQEEPTYRRIVGGTGRKPQDYVTRTALFSNMLDGVRQDGGWTLLVPDLAALSSSMFGNLKDKVVGLLITARDSGVSVMTDFQRPALVPREAGDQATWLGVAYTRDDDVVCRVAEMMGRGRSELRGAMAALGDLKYGWLVVSRDPHQALILTRPDKL
jgi:hypothetical protein